MPNTYTLIQSSTVGVAGTSSFIFNSIPSTYTDLLIKVSSRFNSNGTANLNFRFNSDSGGNYYWQNIQGTGSTVRSTRASATTLFAIEDGIQGTDTTANVFGNAEIYIQNYSSSSQNKTIISRAITENNAQPTRLTITGGLWANSSILSSIEISGATFVQYSTAYLYGIKNS